MSHLDSRRFEHQVSEPKELWDGDIVEMDVMKSKRDLFRLVNSSTHATVCAKSGDAND
jgi:hypothetical protein